MRRDPKAFRERFAAWKNGEQVYDAGRIVDYAKGKDALPGFTGGYDEDALIDYLGTLENPTKHGLKNGIWRPPTDSTKWDVNLIGMGLDMRQEHNPIVYNFLKSKGRLNNPYLTESEERELRRQTWQQKKPILERFIKDKDLSERGILTAAGMLWQGHPYKMMNTPDSVTGKALIKALETGDRDLSTVFDAYYKYPANAKRYASRINSNTNWWNSHPYGEPVEDPVSPTFSRPAPPLDFTASRVSTDVNLPFRRVAADNQVNNTAGWKALNHFETLDILKDLDKGYNWKLPKLPPLFPLDANQWTNSLIGYKGGKDDDFTEFLSELNWSPESWFSKRTPKPDGSLYNDEEAAILKSHVPEYLDIEKSSKSNGTWLSMPDGKKWEGDPRSWVMMQSLAYKKNYLPQPWYTGLAAWPTHFDYGNGNVSTNKLIRAPYYNGQMWFSDNKDYGETFANYIDSKGNNLRDYIESEKNIKGHNFLSAIPIKGKYRLLESPKLNTFDYWKNMPYKKTDDGIERLNDSELRTPGGMRHDVDVPHQSENYRIDNKEVLTDDVVNWSKDLGDDGIYLYKVNDGPVGETNNAGERTLFFTPIINEFISQPGFTNKIKFIEGNTGNFDINDPYKYAYSPKKSKNNIMFARRGKDSLPGYTTGEDGGFLNWLKNAVIGASVADAPAVATASGWHNENGQWVLNRTAADELLGLNLSMLSTFSPTHPATAAIDLGIKKAAPLLRLPASKFIADAVDQSKDYTYTSNSKSSKRLYKKIFGNGLLSYITGWTKTPPAGIEPSKTIRIPSWATLSIENSTIPRMIQMRPELPPNQLRNWIRNNIGETYTKFSDAAYRAAGKGDLAGLYEPAKDFVSIRQGYEDFALLHELRHKLDNAIPLTPEEVKILKQAFNDDFLNLKNTVDKYKDTDLSKEMVTSIGDMRRVLLGDLVDLFAPIAKLNELIDAARDVDIMNALMNANGYTGNYYKALIDKYGQIPSEMFGFFRNAMKKIGMFGGAIGAKKLDNNYKHGKDSGIHIKPENRGKFTALKKRTGKSASWFKAHGTPALKKMATFALNARKWKH